MPSKRPAAGSPLALRRRGANRLLRRGIRGEIDIDGPLLLSYVVWPSAEGGVPDPGQLRAFELGRSRWRAAA